jgi:hypothetical protein
VFLQENMDKRDRVTTSSNEQMRSSVRVQVQGEIPKVARTKVLRRIISED